MNKEKKKQKKKDADPRITLRVISRLIIGYYALIDPSYTLQIDPPKLTALF